LFLPGATMTIPHYLELLLIITVVGAACTDLLTRRIPNRWLLCCALGACGLHLAGAAPGDALLGALGGAATGFAVFIPLYMLRGMAAGDVKLMATTGLFLPAGDVVWLAVLTVCAGGIMALVLIVWRGRLGDAVVNVRALLRPIRMALAGIRLAQEPMPRPSAGSLPYGLAIASATLFFLVQRHG
jgi:prepilin peptidase CpaA